MEEHDDKCHRKKIKQMILYIDKHLIADEPVDLLNLNKNIENIDREEYIKNPYRYMPLTITVTILNSIMGKNTLLEGDSGTGKTTLAKIVGSMLYQIPIEFFDLKTVVGAPKQTRDNIYGTHDVSKMINPELGKSAYLFLPFYAPIVIIDEINRWTNLEQNIVRNGIASDIWDVDGESFHIPEQIVISAMNPDTSGGTHVLNENLADVFSVLLPSPLYRRAADKTVISNKEKIPKLLGKRALVDELKKEYEKDKSDLEHILDTFKKVSEKMKNILDNRGVPYIYNGELAEVRKKIEAMGFDPEARLLEYTIEAEMLESIKYNVNRSGDPISDNEHDTPYLSTKMQEPLRGRFTKDWEDLAKAISWFVGEKKVSIYSLKTAFILTAAHRIKPVTDFCQEVLNNSRNLSVEHEYARRAFEIAYNHYKGWNAKNPKTTEDLRNIIITLQGGKTNLSKEEAIKNLKEIARVHPLGKYLLKAYKKENWRKDLEKYF